MPSSKSVDPLDGEHGAEDLVAAHGHVLGHVVEDGGADEEALLVAGNDSVAAVEHELGAFFHALGDPVLDELLVLGARRPGPVRSPGA